MLEHGKRVNLKNVFLVLIYFQLACLLLGCSENIIDPLRKNEKKTAAIPILGSAHFSVSAINTAPNQYHFFSFDENEPMVSNLAMNDIYLGVTQGTMSFLVFSAVSEAQGVQIEYEDSTPTAKDQTFNKQECLSQDLRYTSKGIPIPQLNSRYCWITNSGNHVEFIVSDISNTISTYYSFNVTIEYALWVELKNRTHSQGD
jgi:hypothetical protein